jgi:hypothetical protein
MRKSGITILLLLYVFTQLGTITWYYYKPLLHAICYNRLWLRPKNDKNECVITMDLASFRKAKADEHEILWKEELYDISAIEINGDKVTIRAEKDATETKWIDIYNVIHEQVSKNKSPHSPIDMRYYQWAFKLYIPAVASGLAATLPNTVVYHNTYYSHYLIIFFPDTPGQPPDLVA